MEQTTDLETFNAVKEAISKFDGWSQKKVEVSARRIKAIIDVLKVVWLWRLLGQSLRLWKPLSNNR